jgi:hypothetical protein
MYFELTRAIGQAADMVEIGRDNLLRVKVEATASIGPQ